LIAMQGGRYTTAIANYQRLVAADPKSLAAAVSLAEAYRLSGDSANAGVVLQKAKQLDPNDGPGSMALAKAFFKNGRLEDAGDVFRRAAQLRPDDAAVLNDLAFVIVETGGDLNEADKLVRRALQKNANYAGALDTLGWIYLKQNKPDDALQIFTSLAKKTPDDPSLHYHLGAALLKKGEKDKARTELQTALAKKPHPAEEKSIRELLAGIQ